MAGGVPLDLRETPASSWPSARFQLLEAAFDLGRVLHVHSGHERQRIGTNVQGGAAVDLARLDRSLRSASNESPAAALIASRAAASSRCSSFSSICFIESARASFASSIRTARGLLRSASDRPWWRRSQSRRHPVGRSRRNWSAALRRRRICSAILLPGTNCSEIHIRPLLLGVDRPAERNRVDLVDHPHHLLHLRFGQFLTQRVLLVAFVASFCFICCCMPACIA